MKKTSFVDVFDSFESSFRDKEVIPDGLELVWLKKAIARYSTELEPLEFDEETLSFNTVIITFLSYPISSS